MSLYSNYSPMKSEASVNMTQSSTNGDSIETINCLG